MLSDSGREFEFLGANSNVFEICTNGEKYESTYKTNIQDEETSKAV